MPSSPPDPAGKWQGLVEAYDLVFEAVARDDLDRAVALVDRADALIAELQAGAPGSAEQQEGLAEIARRARESQGRALAALGDALDRAGAELGKVRRGRKAMQGYGRRGDTVGRRVCRDS